MASNVNERAEDLTVLRSVCDLGEPLPHVRAVFERLLPLLYAHVGNRCNLRCPYCSVDYRRVVSTDASEIRDLLDRAAAAGLRKVSLLGGEPTFRPDLPDLLAHARQAGFTEINITTNGQRLADAAYLDTLVAAGLTSVQFSLHAADEALIGALAADPAAGGRALAALENLLARPQLWLLLASVVATPTLAHLPAHVEAVAGWSARAGRALPLLLTALVPQGRAFEHRAEMVPRPREAALAVRRALERARDLGVAAAHRNLPSCLLPGWEAWSADACIENVRRRLSTGETLPMQRDAAMLKRSDCLRCRWEAPCSGVHAGMIATHGWGDYQPVPAPGAAARIEPLRSALRRRPTGRAVVVGGAGLVGRQVLQRLVEADWHVTSVSRRGEPGAAADPAVTFVRGDRRDPAVLADLLAAQPELWIDLALFDAAEAEALVRAWPAGSATRLVAAGSIAEYGALHRLPMPIDEDAPLAADDPYGRGKVQAWQVLRVAAAERGLRASWAVLPQLWGPGDRHYRDGALVHALLEGRLIVLRGEGTGRLTDGYAGTAAEALLHLACTPGLEGARLNVGGPDDLSALDYVRLAAETLRRDASVLLVPARAVATLERERQVRVRQVFPDRDVTLARARLLASGFQPSCTAADGVRITAYAHSDRPPPPGGSPYDLPDELVHALARVPGARTVRVG